MGLNQKELYYLTSQHREYWDRQRERMSAYTSAYKCSMFGSERDNAFNRNSFISVETADAYAYIEGFIASLYSKAPALTVGADAQNKGDPEVVEAVVNRFLYDKIDIVEQGLRYALLYPYSFFKMGVLDRDKVIDSVAIRAVHPWDVVVDFEAEDFAASRFIGHRYFLPYNEAKEKFPSVKFNPVAKEEYLRYVESAKGSVGYENADYDAAVAGFDGSKLLSYVEIYEYYDLMEDELIFYSPSAERQNKIIDTVSPIPFRKQDGSPCPPLAPIYLSYSPEAPLKGFSSMARIYDQLYEINNLRTVWANGLRRDARIYVAQKGALDEEGKAILAQNIDQSVVELDVPPDSDARNVIVPLATATYSPDYSIYKAEIRADLDRGSVMAPFTRGVATQASATEIAALTSYANSEIGRLARFFHRAIEMCGEIYQSLIFHLLMTGEDADETREVVLIDYKPRVISPEAFSGKFRYSFADQSSSPITTAVKKATIMQLIPTLGELGAPPEELLSYIISTFDLPESFMKTQAAEAPGGVAPGLNEDEAPAEMGEAGLPVGGGRAAAAIRSEGQEQIATQMEEA